MTVTTAEAAEILQTSEANVWQLVNRRHLTPVRPGAKPLRFDEDQVLDLRHRRQPARERQRIARLADAFLAG